MLRLAITLTLVLLLGYGAFKAAPLLSGPHLALESPVDGQSFPGGFVQVSGVASRTEDLTLNGTPLLIDESGHFTTSLVLPHGGAILSLTATDRFGKTERASRTILVP